MEINATLDNDTVNKQPHPIQWDRFWMILGQLGQDFSEIPDGFTGVWMRNDKLIIVPNELLPKVKELSNYGYFDFPESKQIHLLCRKNSRSGEELIRAIDEQLAIWICQNIVKHG